MFTLNNSTTHLKILGFFEGSLTNKLFLNGYPSNFEIKSTESYTVKEST